MLLPKRRPSGPWLRCCSAGKSRLGNQLLCPIQTAVLYTLRDHKEEPLEQLRKDISASFQHAAFTDIVNKTLKAAKQTDCRTILFGGGVTNNQTLRKYFQEADPSYNYIWPSIGLSLDNAAMIAGLGYHYFLKKGQGDTMDLEPLARMGF